jgi:SnoaL-like domain
MSAEDRIKIEQANAAFYRALESSVIERMEEVWAHDSWVRCVHPGWDMLTGWAQVRESWAMIFEGGQKIRAFPSDVWVYISGEFACVT